MIKFCFYTLASASILFFTGTSSAATLSCDPVQGNYTEGFGVSNMSFRDNVADACAGLFYGNDAGQNGNGLENLNDSFGGDWSLILKSDEQLNASLDEFAVDFTLSEFPTEQTFGSWQLSWLGDDLPIQLDFAAVIKTGDSWAAYLFEDEILQVSPNMGAGTWESAFLNNSGGLQALSHFSLYIRDVSQPILTPPSEIPAPASLALMLIGLFGFALIKKRNT